MMKTIKTAFYSTVALAAVSTAAHADALADLKSLIAKVNDSDALYQAAVQVPRGYSISPTADSAPADAAAAVAVEEPFVDVKVSGYIKAGYIYSQIRDGLPNYGSGANVRPHDSSSDFDAEAGVNVKGSVQSSLGEVGTTIQAKWDIAESTNNLATTALRDDGFIGFWQFADTMKLEMGRSNGGRLENGIDKNTRRLWVFANRRVRSENAGNGFYDRDMYNGFMGLAYASGPVSFTVRGHDATRGVGGGGFDDDAIGVSAKGAFTSDMINLEVSGGYWNEDDAGTLSIDKQTGVKWLAGAGTELNFIPGVPVSLAAQAGKLWSGADMYNVSGSIGLTLTDSITAGIGAGLKKVSNSPTLADNRTEKAITGGIYYVPLAQMTIGLEADWLDDGRPSVGSGAGLSALSPSNDGFSGAVITRYAF
jgi:hypothetical protein